METKKTPLYKKHVELKARMVNFAGWDMPLEYGSVLSEARAVRSSCGIFDASHMGQIRVSGPGALEFLQFLTCNDVASLAPGRQQYNLFMNSQGGVIDDFMLYRMDDGFLCVVNAANKDKVLNWLSSRLAPGVCVKDESAAWALISLQGPHAVDVLGGVLSYDFYSLEYMSFTASCLGGKTIFISRSGYTGEDGFEIYCDSSFASSFWDRIVHSGRRFGLEFCGLAARDILRIEAGYPLYGRELDDAVSPYQASLAWVVKINKDFIGKDKILEQRESSRGRKRIGFIMEEKSVPRAGYEVYAEHRPLGQVTSGAYSPNLDKFIGMAYVDDNSITAGTAVFVKVRECLRRARVVKFPFVKIKTRRIACQS